MIVDQNFGQNTRRNTGYHMSVLYKSLSVNCSLSTIIFSMIFGIKLFLCAVFASTNSTGEPLYVNNIVENVINKWNYCLVLHNFYF